MFNKKNDNRPARKLSLTKETVRRLNESLNERQLKEAAGGRSAGCWCSENCPISDTTAPC